MIRRIRLLLAAAVLAVMMLMVNAVPVFAANAPAGCDKDRGTITCTEDGKSNNPKFTQTTTQKGSFQSSHPEENTCSDPCPPGQFK